MPRRANPYIEDIITANPDGLRAIFLALREDQNKGVALAQDLRKRESAIRWKVTSGPPSPKQPFANTAEERAIVRAARVKRSERIDHSTHAERMKLRAQRDGGAVERRRRHLVLSLFRGKAYRACEANAKILPYIEAKHLVALKVPADLSKVLATRFEAWVKEPPITLSIPVDTREPVAVAAAA